MMSSLLERSFLRNQGLWKRRKIALYNLISGEGRKTLWKQQGYGQEPEARSLFRQGKWEHFSKKWHHPGERKVGPGSKVLTYINELAVCTRGSQELGLKSAFLSLGHPKVLYQEKEVWAGYPQDNPGCERRLGNTGDKGSEIPALQLSLVKLRSPRISKTTVPHRTGLKTVTRQALCS